MVSLECNDCGREEHFTSIEDATTQGWQFDEYVWLCPLCLNPKDIIDTDTDDDDDNDSEDEDDIGSDSLMPSFGGGSFGGGGASF